MGVFINKINAIERELRAKKEENISLLLQLKKLEDENTKLCEEIHILKLGMLNLGEFSNFN